MGYSEQVAVVTLAAWNLASTAGRVGAGIAADRLLGPLNSLLACLLLMGFSALVVWPLSQSTGVFVVYLVLNGLGCGAFFSLVPSTLGQLFGAKNTMGLVPIVWTTWFCGFFFVSPSSFPQWHVLIQAGHPDCVRPILSCRAHGRPGAVPTGGVLRRRHVNCRLFHHAYRMVLASGRVSKGGRRVIDADVHKLRPNITALLSSTSSHF